MYNKWKDKSIIGQIGEIIFEDFCKERSITYIDKRNDDYHRQHDNDYVISKNDINLNIEVKTDTRDFYNMPVELIKNCSR